jgi:hypothetical protein
LRYGAEELAVVFKIQGEAASVQQADCLGMGRHRSSKVVSGWRVWGKVLDGSYRAFQVLAGYNVLPACLT